MNMLLTTPVWILMLFGYDYHGINTANSYVVRDQNLCNLAAQTHFVNQTGSTGFCTKVDSISAVQYQCGGEHVEITNPCLRKLPDDLVLGPYGNVLYMPKIKFH